MRLNRLAQALTVFLIAGLSSQCLIRLLPGDPIDTLMAETGTTLSRAVLLKELHLEDPWYIAAPKSLFQALQGDFGVSLFSKRAIQPILLERLTRTFSLASTALALALAFALPLSLLAAQNFRPALSRRASQACDLWATFSAAIPTPWLGPILLLLFTVEVRIFPLERHIALPALTLAFSIGGNWSRLIRDRVHEQVETSWFRAARARGKNEYTLLLRDGLAPSSSLLLGHLGSQWGALMAGAYITEVLFGWPGIGSWMIEGVLRRDYPVVQAGVLATSFFALLGNFLGDLASTQVDPRARGFTQ